MNDPGKREFPNPSLSIYSSQLLKSKSSYDIVLMPAPLDQVTYSILLMHVPKHLETLKSHARLDNVV